MPEAQLLTPCTDISLLQWLLEILINLHGVFRNILKALVKYIMNEYLNEMESYVIPVIRCNLFILSLSVYMHP